MSQLRAFIERIERLKAEEDALKEDVRAVYAEAASEGFDKTAMGQVVTLRRKRAKNPEKFEEMSTVVELYLAEIEGPSHVHTREGDQSNTDRVIPSPHSRSAAAGGVAPNTLPAAPLREDLRSNAGEAVS